VAIVSYCVSILVSIQMNIARGQPQKRKTCPHGRDKCKCKDCGGSSVCAHGRIKSRCKYCGGSQICSHNRLTAKSVEGRQFASTVDESRDVRNVKEALYVSMTDQSHNAKSVKDPRSALIID
jgi:hypothetical protein